MKTIKYLSVIIIFFSSVQLEAQIQVLSNGAVGTGTTIPSGYNASLYGRYFYIGTTAYTPNGMFKFDCGNSNPRIWSPSGSIAFYSNETSTFIDIQVKTCYQNSDLNAKTNIKTLSNSLETLKKLRGVSFNWRNDISDVKAVQSKPAKLDYGLIAQEVEKIVPDLVITNDSTQGKMLSYTGIIPILIEAIKDLSAQVDVQKQQIDELNSSNQKSAQTSSDMQSTSVSVATLAQNNPNPFNKNTEIRYYLPETTQFATIYIYNMNGLQIKAFPLQGNGNGSLTINGSEMQAGMYIYTLIAEGKEIDTKRMILTQ